MLRSLVPVLVVALASLPAASAIAQSGSGDKAAADALFDEGKRLLAAGDTAQACTRFETSLKLFDQLGTRLNLADCYDKAGRTASAWAEFREAASLATKRGDRRAKYARDRADALQPRLVKLAIVVPLASRLPGLEVRRNGVAVPPELFDTPVPVDPGKYAIEVAAGGHQAWSSSVDASASGGEIKVEVPRLDAVAPPAPAPRPEPPTPDKLSAPVGPAAVASGDDHPSDPGARHRRHLISYAIGGAGVVAFGVGAVLGLEARHKWDDAGAHCADSVCDATGVAINRDARSLGTTGTIVGGVGLAAVAAAVVIYLTAPAASPIAEHARLELLPRSGGIMTWTARF